MTKILNRAAAVAITLTLLLPTTAAADPTPRQWTGIALLAGGGLTMAASINWDMECPSGYNIHYFDHIPTQCSYIGRTMTDVTDAEPNMGILYPTMFYSGLGAVGVGIILLAMPAKVRKASPDVAFSPKGVTVGKTLRW